MLDRLSANQSLTSEFPIPMQDNTKVSVAFQQRSRENENCVSRYISYSCSDFTVKGLHASELICTQKIMFFVADCGCLNNEFLSGLQQQEEQQEKQQEKQQEQLEKHQTKATIHISKPIE